MNLVHWFEGQACLWTDVINTVEAISFEQKRNIWKKKLYLCTKKLNLAKSHYHPPMPPQAKKSQLTPNHTRWLSQSWSQTFLWSSLPNPWMRITRIKLIMAHDSRLCLISSFALFCFLVLFHHHHRRFSSNAKQMLMRKNVVFIVQPEPQIAAKLNWK